MSGRSQARIAALTAGLLILALLGHLLEQPLARDHLVLSDVPALANVAEAGGAFG